MPGRYTDDTLDVAASLWGVVLDMRHAIAAIHSDVAAHARDVAASFERMGTTALRLCVLGWTEFVEAAWYDAPRTCDKLFDQDFVPRWIIDNIDWTSGNQPMMRPPSPAPEPPGYDVAITLVLNAVVRTDGGSDAALLAANLLLNQIEARNSCVDGAQYGVPAVTEFSIGSAGEAIDVDPISKEV